MDVSATVTAPPSDWQRHCAQLVRRNQDPGSEARSYPSHGFDPRSLSPSRRRLRRLAKSSRCGRLGSGPDRLRRIEHDAHLHLHAEMVRRKSDKGAVKRDRVARIGDNCNGDKADVADAAACRIEINPSGARQINLRPGMSSIRDLSCSSAPSDRPTGLRDTPTQNARRNQSSAPPRSSAWRSRGNSHGRAGASLPAAGRPSLPVACKRSRDGCLVTTV